jgi:hypothetical protein
MSEAEKIETKEKKKERKEGTYIREFTALQVNFILCQL